MRPDTLEDKHRNDVPFTTQHRTEDAAAPSPAAAGSTQCYLRLRAEAASSLEGGALAAHWDNHRAGAAARSPRANSRSPPAPPRCHAAPLSDTRGPQPPQQQPPPPSPPTAHPGSKADGSICWIVCPFLTSISPGLSGESSGRPLEPMGPPSETPSRQSDLRAGRQWPAMAGGQALPLQAGPRQRQESRSATDLGVVEQAPPAAAGAAVGGGSVVGCNGGGGA
jgi:hypothetical protein